RRKNEWGMGVERRKGEGGGGVGEDGRGLGAGRERRDGGSGGGDGEEGGWRKEGVKGEGRVV
ncbi:hypothetical protein, partial [Neisseria sicca]|uniref:hypothetical protein n=1 Tax=Neisseria sicca TaxID=490 RepID=UPI001C9A030A